MLIHTKRIFMNEADAPSGAAPSAPAVPPASTAAPETPAPMTADQVANIVATTVETRLKAFENGLFANARKAGLLGKEKPSPDSSATVTPSAAASTGLTEADLEARLEQERVLTRVQVENKLPDAAIKRMKSALKTDKPDDISAWTSSYLADLGLVRPVQETATQTTTTPAPAVPVVPNTAPLSDRGSPAPTGAVGWRHEFQLNGGFMSKAAKEQMDAELGPEKARRQRLDAAQAQASRMTVSFGPKG